MAAEAVSARPRQRLQEELVPRSQQSRSRQRPSSDDDSNQSSNSGRSEGYRRRGRGRGEQGQVAQPPPAPITPSTPSPTPVTTQPVGSPTPVSASPDSRSLAEKYVSQYEEQSGTTLSAEARAAKVEEVASFYDSPSRSGRLSKIVFA